MSNFIFEQDGAYALSSLSYYIIIAVLVIVIILTGIVVDKKQGNTRFSTKRLATCGVLLALGFLLSYIKIFDPPFGGSITLFSMFCICLVGYFYGIKAGLLTAFAYSLLQFFQGGGSYMLSPLQIFCDYFFAFTALGVTGFFYKKKKAFIPAFLLAVFLRGVFHSIGGYLYWMDYMPENFPTSLTAIYPIVYNYTYLLGEAVLTVIVLMIPAVKKVFLKLQALTDDTN